MAKKNQNTKKHLRDIEATKKKSQMVFRFAYMLYTGPRGTGAEKAVKQLLSLRRKELPGETLPPGTGSLSKYKKLMLDTGSNFESLALVLLKATEDASLARRVGEILLTHFDEDMFRFMDTSVAGRYNYLLNYDRETVERRIEGYINSDPAVQYFGRMMTASWAGIYEYIDIMCRWDERAACGIPFHYGLSRTKGVAEDISDFVNTDYTKDTEWINNYSNTAAFYRLVTENVVPLLTSFRVEGPREYDARLEFDSAYHMLKTVYENRDDDISKYREALSEGLLVKKDLADRTPDIPPASFDKNAEWIKIWFAAILCSLRCEYLLSGIDLFSVANLACVSEKECRIAVKKAFYYYEIRYFADSGERAFCTYEKDSDKVAVLEMVARFWAESLISGNLDLLLDEKRLTRSRKENKELSDARALIDSLRSEIKELRDRPEKARNIELSELMERNSLIKTLRADLHKREKELSGAEARIAALEEENRDLRSMADTLMQEGDDEVAAVDTAGGLAEESFREYIKSHKVLVWGLRTSTEQKYAELYPELSFADSNRKLTAQQLEGCDTFIMCTSNTSHGRYWAARDTVKRSGVKMAYLAKTMNDPRHLWHALDVALNGPDRERE